MGNRHQRQEREQRQQPRGPLSATIAVLAVAGLIVLVGLGVVYLTAGDSGPDSSSGSVAAGTQNAASGIMLPDFVMAASSDTQMAYQFALDRPDVMMWVPCYCGCGEHSGHKNARDCFVMQSTATGATFDRHGAGCDVCVGIALEAKRLTEEGKSVREIRASVDDKFSSIGPSTNTPLPPG